LKAAIVNLPSERALADAMQISRTTAKRCYDELRANRASTHGRGSPVVQAPPQVHHPTMGSLKGFTEEKEVAGYDLSAAPALEDWDTGGSVYAFLQEKCNITFVRPDQTIEAVISTEEEAAVFGCAQPNTACY
jgi:GntR family transcriptional regulator